MDKKNIISKITACMLAVILLLSNATYDVYAQDSLTHTAIRFNVNLNLQSFSPEMLSKISSAYVNITVNSQSTGETLYGKQINLRDFISENAQSRSITLGVRTMSGVYGGTAIYTISIPDVIGPDGSHYNNNAPLGINSNVLTAQILPQPQQTDPNQYMATPTVGLTVYPKHEVSFIGMDNQVLACNYYETNADVSAPEAPFVDGYRFTGWSPEFSAKATKSVAYVAQYEALNNNVEPTPTVPGEYNQDNNNDTNPPQVEVTFTKEANYQVSIPLALKLSPKEIKAEDVIEAYNIEKTQQAPTLTDITEQVAGKVIWYNSFPIQAKGLIDASSVVKVEPSNFTLRAEDGDTASAITKANVTDLSATSVKFKNPLNADITDAYELPNDYDTTQTATGFIWVDDDDIDSASVYKGTMNFTISLEPNS